MNGTDMEEIPFQKVKTKRKKCYHCCCSLQAAAASGTGAGLGEPPPLLLLDAIACEDEFDCKELEALFQSYNLKLEQTSTLKALAVLIVLTASLALVELLSGPSLTISKGSHPVHCIIFLSLFIVTNVKYLQVTQLQQIVKLTLLFSFTFSFLCCPFSLGAYGVEPPSAPEQGMWQLMLVTFVSYSLLPVRTLLAIVFGLVVSVSHLIVTATSVSAKRQRLWRTVIEEHLTNEEEWKWVPAWGDNNKNFSPSLSQVPLHNRYEVLDLEGQLDDVEENFLPSLKGKGDAAGLSESRPEGCKAELGAKSVAQLRCIYTNVCSMGNKKEELEAMVQQSYDVVAITGTWWDESHSWSTALNGYKLFRRDRQGRRGGGVALYIKQTFDTVGIETKEDGVECLWVRIKGKANKADILLRVCYRPPNQEEEVDNLFYKQVMFQDHQPLFL
ncbi:hypothetical protein DUI87_17685 [Hirundo rustica rustica]|uniref:Adenylate cyclase N-terminal domain-containing protein n=1 Tax=Hirundo rustica rustica TaxID=333673 RepID=A0A3M0K2Z3_HIRRU|nr:hypothetical protein DUI87_17685 [Hirundo rustica rustica]